MATFLNLIEIYCLLHNLVFVKMMKFALKAGITGGIIYYVSEQGVWKDSETTRELYTKLKNETCPYVNQGIALLPFELPKIPQKDNVMQLGKHYWNCGVKSVFSFLINSPTYISNWSQSAYDSLIEFSKSPEPAQKD